MAWRLAYSLATLRDQINDAYPDRSKISDGTIGDSAHASRSSDHNPNPQGVVCALDLTHDPAHGFDAHALAELQRKNPHPQLKYIVSKGRIASRKHGWVWRNSSGHYQHVHLSVGEGFDGRSKPGTYDSRELWNIGLGSEGTSSGVLEFEEDDMKTAIKTVTIGGDGRGYVLFGGQTKATPWGILNSSDPVDADSNKGKARYGSFEGIVLSGFIHEGRPGLAVEGAKAGAKFDVRGYWV